MHKQTPNDSTWHRIEEQRHQRHAEIRAAHLHGDGTIEQEEGQRAAMLAAKYRNERDELKAANKAWREEVAALMAAGYSFDAATQFAGGQS